MNLQDELIHHLDAAEALRVARQLVYTHFDVLDVASEKLERIRETEDNVQRARLSRTLKNVQEGCRALETAYMALDGAYQESSATARAVDCITKKRTAAFHLVADGDVFYLEARDDKGHVLSTDELTERDEDRAIASAVRAAQKQRLPITFDI